MIKHPEVEIYYENENGDESLSEDYEVFVDENCSNCHESFLPQSHFNPLIPAHNLSSNWNDLPWWFDNKYLMFFNDRNDSSSVSSSYQHVNTQRRNDLPPVEQGGYSPGYGSSGSASGSQTASKETTTVNDVSDSNSDTRSRSGIRNQRSGSSSRSGDSTSKRKFRKRK